MKKKNLNLKLQLKKETIANLNNEEMKNLKGGATASVCRCTWTQVPTCNDGGTCYPSNPCC